MSTPEYRIGSTVRFKGLLPGMEHIVTVAKKCTVHGGMLNMHRIPKDGVPGFEGEASSWGSDRWGRDTDIIEVKNY